MTRSPLRYWLVGLAVSGLLAGLAVWRLGGRTPTPALAAEEREERTSSQAGPEEEGWPLSLFFAQLPREKPIALQPQALPDSQEGQKELRRACLRRDQGADATALFQQIAEKYQGQQPGLRALFELSRVHRYEATRLEWVDEKVAAQLRLAEAYPTALTAPQMLAYTVSDLVGAYRESVRETSGGPEGPVQDRTIFGNPSRQHWRTLWESLARLLGRYPESRYGRPALEEAGQLLAGRPETAAQARKLAEWARARYPQDADFGARMEMVVAASFVTEGNLAEAVQRLHAAFQVSAGLIRDATAMGLHGFLEGIVRTHPELQPPEPRPDGPILLPQPKFERTGGFVLLDESPEIRKMGWRSHPWETREVGSVPGEPGPPKKYAVYPLPCGVREAAAWYGPSPEVALNVQGRPVCSIATSLLLTPSFPVYEGDTLFYSGSAWFRQTARKVGDTVEVTLRANEDFVVRQVWRPGEFWWREATWEFQAAVSVGFSARVVSDPDFSGGRAAPPAKEFRLTARRLLDEPPSLTPPSPAQLREGFNAVEFWGFDDPLLDLLAQCVRDLLSPVDAPGYLEKIEAARRRGTYYFGSPRPQEAPLSPEDLVKLARQELDPCSDEGIRVNALLAKAFFDAKRFEETAERYRLLDAARDQSETTDWQVRSVLDRPFEGPWTQALAALGRREEVVQLLRRTQQKRPLRTAEGLLLADTLFELGDYRAAAAAYTVLPITGNALGARRLLREGRAWAHVGDALRAQRAWRECVRYFPDSSEAAEARPQANAQPEADTLLEARRQEKRWEDFGPRAMWDYAASDLPEGGQITGQVALDREGDPKILIHTYDHSSGRTLHYVVDPTARTLQPTDRDRFQTAYETTYWLYQQNLRKHEVCRDEDFVLWQQAETLTLTALDGTVRWKYTVENEVEDERSPGIPLLAGVTVTRVDGKPILVFGVQQRTVSVGMALIYYPVSGDLRCLGLDGKERWQRSCAPCEQVLVVAPPHATPSVVYVLGVIPDESGRESQKARRVLECFDLASGRSLRRIDLPSAFAEGRHWREVTRLEARDFSPAEPGCEILVKAGQAFGMYSARGRTLYEEKTRPVLYAAPARLRGSTEQVVCIFGQEDEPSTTLAVLDSEGQVCWKWDHTRFDQYNIEFQIAAADLDGDGCEEIIAFDSETVYVFGFRG